MSKTSVSDHQHPAGTISVSQLLKHKGVRFWILYCAIGLTAWLIFGVAVPRHYEYKCLAKSKQNLHSIQFAIERYAVDSEGTYPTDLSVLSEEGYMPTMPINPYSNKPMQWYSPDSHPPPGDFIYEVTDHGDRYSLYLY